MDSYHKILSKLRLFTNKYYTKILIKGVLLFLALGLLFFFVILGVEYFLWLNSTGRFVLLFVFVAVELYLLFRYILTPIFYLFKLRKGISNRQASLIIGKHFPNVGDRLYNLLDLKDDTNQSELLLASIEQRSEGLSPIPFTNAVDFRENIKYIKYLAIPAVVIGLLWISGNWNSFFGSYDRVVNYDLAYEPPAPFSFKLLTNELTVLNTKPHTIMVTTEGDVRPESVFITIEGKKLLLQEQNGIYKYTFSPPLQTTAFSFEADEVSSRQYTLEALVTPSIQNFKLVLDYPKYTQKSSEVLESTGSATFPEGTMVTWQIDGKYTERIHLVAKDTTLLFDKMDDAFKLSKRVYNNFPYLLSTSNENVVDYEKLEYEFNVTKDAYPSIKAKLVIDSLNPNTLYYIGEASDDYKLNKIALVWYADDELDKKQVLDLGRPNSNFKQFYYTFPSGLNLDAGRNYSYYFEATDNDAIHKGKTSKSQVFSMVLLDDNQLKNKELESQQSIIKNMDRSLEKFKEQKETLREINQEQKEKNQLNFNDKNEIKDFLKKQQRQESMMQKFSKQLKENLEKKDTNDKLNELLKERLERHEIQARKNEKLLEELRKISDKINKEDLKKKLEEIAKKQKNSERSLEQLLELTKRYYVTEKAAQLAKDLEKLAERQDAAAEYKEEEKKSEGQEELNKEFDKLAEELNELKKDNQDLKKPLDLDISEKKEESVKSDQQKASEELKNEENEASDSQEKKEASDKASQKQKSAAQKMKEMSEQLQQSSSAGGGGSTITEDAEMLRQVLDNLVTFSFKQEKLFDNLKEADFETPHFSGTIRKQQELRGLFEHVDDSLFALSLRRAELSEFVNEQITEVYYNIDKSLETIAENQIYQGVSYQKYVLSASNSLADFLAKLLDNMQESMQSGKGEGQGQSFQLPDIIKSQGELQDKMKGEGKSEGEGEGKEGGESGKEGREGEGEGEGKGKKQGGESGEGNSGNQGNSGEDGEGQGGRGNSGKDDKNGEGKGKNGQGNAGGQGQGGPSEAELKEIYEIYKQQQQIRQQLEDQLQNMINNSDRKLGEKLIKQMEDFENDLIENGFTSRGMSKMNNIQYELLKLENAAMKQGKKPERESNANINNFTNPITTKPSLLENYRNEIEILNRQALPLRQNYQNKVKEYFKNND